MVERDQHVAKGTLSAPVESALTKKKKDKDEIQADPKSDRLAILRVSPMSY